MEVGEILGRLGFTIQTLLVEQVFITVLLEEAILEGRELRMWGVTGMNLGVPRVRILIPLLGIWELMARTRISRNGSLIMLLRLQEVLIKRLLQILDPTEVLAATTTPQAHVKQARPPSMILQEHLL